MRSGRRNRSVACLSRYQRCASPFLSDLNHLEEQTGTDNVVADFSNTSIQSAGQEIVNTLPAIMSSEGIPSKIDSPQGKPKRMSRREKQEQRHTQWKLKKDLEKLDLTSSQNAEDVDEPQRKSKRVPYKEYEKQRRNRRKLNHELRKLDLKHVVDADTKETESKGDGQVAGQTAHQKRKYDQFGSFVDPVEDKNSNEPTHGIGAPTHSELAKLGFEDLKSSNATHTEKTGLSDVQMDDAQE